MTDHRKLVEAGRMAAYAAAVDEVDQSVGRLLQYIEDAGIADGTLVLFLSDNGGDYSNGSIAADENQVPWEPGSNPTSSNGWASVKCTPFRFYKHSCHEGGIATPMIVRWPTGIDRVPSTVVSEPASITDIYPTLLELAEVDYPAEFAGNKKRLPTGHSLLPLFNRNGQRENRPLFQWYTFSRAWIEDEWKVVSLYGGPWQLFDLRGDRTESIDLAETHPDRVDQSVKAWETFANDSQVPNPRTRAIKLQHRWGWHRLKRACPSLISMEPANGSTTNTTKLTLRLSFDRPIDFTDTGGKRIALYDVSDESKPVWDSDPDPTHLAHGKQSILFDTLPELKSDRHYAIRWDAGWIKVGAEPIGGLNDGAYWW